MGLKPGTQLKKILDQLFDVRLNGEIKAESEERDLVMKLAGLKTEG